MIFVTVGTHEQQFNRLIRYVDELKEKGIIKEDIVIQTGYSTYVPKNCENKKMFSQQDMQSKVEEAHIVISHGGPASFSTALQCGKVPIVVPRQKIFDEHVNNHQLEYVREVAKREGNIIVVEDIEKLGDAIANYDQIIQEISVEINSNNAEFNRKLEELIDELFEEKK